MLTKAYVFIDLPPPHHDPVLARLAVTDGSAEQYTYDPGYLLRSDALALDPLHLPLSPDTFTILGNQGVPTALLDAGPDTWGRKLMQAFHRHQPANKLEALLATRGTGVSALRFSLSRTRPAARPTFPILAYLNAIKANITQITQCITDEKVSSELQRLFEPGCSMGGARPKTVVQDDASRLWIAKLNRSDDSFDQAKAEQMCFLMMRDLGIRCCNTQLHEIADQSVLLVERFDHTPGQCRRHFISAHALLYQHRVKAEEVAYRFSYPRLAEIVSCLCVNAQDDKRELFKRMVFNALVSNTDDHLRNHGFLLVPGTSRYTLAPAYDVVPQSSPRRLHAIGLGKTGVRCLTLTSSPHIHSSVWMK